jgi:tRNA pseudouridine38-40 synthase
VSTEPSALRTLRLTIEYDGTDFAGWQRQLNQRTVQQCLEEAFATMTGTALHVQGAGRTDAGVHAEGQVASVQVASRIPALGFMRGLNSNLPHDIAVLDVADVPDSFNARRSARGKIYRYSIWNHPVRSPRHARTSWHVFAQLDVHRMRDAAAILCGEHDFRAFRAADCERISTVRQIRRFDVRCQGPLVTCEVEGTAFLKNMVRILVGTLVAVGHGALDVNNIHELLAHGDRTKAGMTAPARGLTLAQVIY